MQFSDHFYNFELPLCYNSCTNQFYFIFINIFYIYSLFINSNNIVKPLPSYSSVSMPNIILFHGLRCKADSTQFHKSDNS